MTKRISWNDYKNDSILEELSYGISLVKIYMILLDQIIRYISKDIMLPTRCYATKKQFVCIKDCCECKIFCKKPPKGSIPAPVRINNRNN